MRVFIYVGALALLSGCSVFSTKYNCGAIPRAGCVPVAKVYEQTHTKNEYRGVDQKVNGSEKPVTGAAKTNATTVDSTTPGDPLLSKPKVMRVLYSSFENTEGDLDAGGYVYLRMQESKWLVER